MNRTDCEYKSFCGLPECPGIEDCDTYVYYCETLDDLDRVGLDVDNGEVKDVIVVKITKWR